MSKQNVQQSITDRWAESNAHLELSDGPECLRCKNYAKDGTRTCLAFTDGIPDAIWGQIVLHRDPFPGDQGVQYEEQQQE